VAFVKAVVGTERDNRLGHCRFRFCQLAARARTKIKIKINIKLCINDIYLEFTFFFVFIYLFGALLIIYYYYYLLLLLFGCQIQRSMSYIGPESIPTSTSDVVRRSTL
jgi:hypothetical protein